MLRFLLFFGLVSALVAVSSCKSNKQGLDPVTEEASGESNEADAEEKVAETSETAPEVMPVSEDEIAARKPKYPDSLYFRMEKTPCFGKCPVYVVDVYQSGRAVLSGRRNFDFIGKFTTRFNQAEMQQIMDAAEANDYFSLRHVYDAPVTDLPSTTTILRSDDREHWVYNRMNSPERLRAFEQLCEDLVKSKDWEAVSTE